MAEDNCICKPTEILILAKEKCIILQVLVGMLVGLLSRQKLLKKLLQLTVVLFFVQKKTLIHAGFNADVHLVVTDLEIQKNYDFTLNDDEIKKVTDIVIDKLKK